MEEKIKTESVLSSIVCKSIKSETKGMKTSFHEAICDHSCRIFLQLQALYCFRRYQELRNSRKDTLIRHMSKTNYGEKLKTVVGIH